MEKISLTQLIGNVQPIAEIEYKGKTIQILQPDDLPEKYYLRLKQANVKLTEMFETIAPQMAREQVLLLMGQDKNKINTAAIEEELPRLSAVVSSTSIQYEGYRMWLEAIMQLEPGALSSEPARAINELYQLLQKIVKSDEVIAEDIDAPEPKKIEADTGKGRQKASVNTSNS